MRSTDTAIQLSLGVTSTLQPFLPGLWLLLCLPNQLISQTFSEFRPGRAPHARGLVDDSDTIVAVNRAWRDFARFNRGIEQRTVEGVDYLRVRDLAAGE